MEPKPTIIEGLLLAAYDDEAGQDYIGEVQEFLTDNLFVVERIKDHIALRIPIFNLPSILLVYLSVHKSARRAKESWPLTPAEMEPLLNAS